MNLLRHLRSVIGDHGLIRIHDHMLHCLLAFSHPPQRGQSEHIRPVQTLIRYLKWLRTSWRLVWGWRGIAAAALLGKSRRSRRAT
jgi:hypothetical protein